MHACDRISPNSFLFGIIINCYLQIIMLCDWHVVEAKLSRAVKNDIEFESFADWCQKCPKRIVKQYARKLSMILEPSKTMTPISSFLAKSSRTEATCWTPKSRRAMISFTCQIDVVFTSSYPTTSNSQRSFISRVFWRNNISLAFGRAGLMNFPYNITYDKAPTIVGWN